MNKHIICCLLAASIFITASAFAASDFECLQQCDHVAFMPDGFQFVFHMAPVSPVMAGYVWTRDRVYNLNQGREFILNFEASISGRQEIIIAFSANRGTWNEQNSDALTLSIRTPDSISGRVPWGSAVRTGLFRHYKGFNDKTIEKNGWRRIKVRLTESQACLLLDGQKVICSKLQSGDVPLSGYVGFLGFGMGMDTTKYRNIRFRSQ